jgi:ATP-dependent NAD(P)H-hydrate dehydratase
MESQMLLTHLKRTAIVQLSGVLHKGCCGRIAVVGGSEDYSGAPYLSAMSALRCGADLSYIFCPPVAAASIKAYSPEIVVRPLLSEDRIEELLSALGNCHAAVVGPGLGTQPAALGLARRVIDRVMELGIPLVVDADGLRIVESDPSALHRPPSNSESMGEPSAAVTVVTPNAMEMRRLLEKCQVKPTTEGNDAVVSQLAKRLRCYVLAKGEFDVIAASEDSAAVARIGGGAPRRAAGQGDVLTGILATFLAWDKLSRRSASNTGAAVGSNDPMASLVVGCHVMREAQRLCFAHPDLGRGYVASDLLRFIPTAFVTVTQPVEGEQHLSMAARSKV